MSLTVSTVSYISDTYSCGGAKAAIVKRTRLLLVVMATFVLVVGVVGVVIKTSPFI